MVQSEATFAMAHAAMLLLDVGMMTVLSREALLLEAGCLVSAAACLMTMRAGLRLLFQRVMQGSRSQVRPPQLRLHIAGSRYR